MSEDGIRERTLAISASFIFNSLQVVPEHWPLWQLLVIQVTAGVVIYIVLVLLFRLRACQDIRRLVAERLNSPAKGDEA